MDVGHGQTVDAVKEKRLRNFHPVRDTIPVLIPSSGWQWHCKECILLGKHGNEVKGGEYPSPCIIHYDDEKMTMVEFNRFNRTMEALNNTIIDKEGRL